MSNPSKTAYADAQAVVAAGDKVMINEAAEAFAPVDAALDTAIAALMTARDRYPSPNTSPVQGFIDSWVSQLQSFKNTVVHLDNAAQTEKARFNAPDPSPPAPEA